MSVMQIATLVLEAILGLFTAYGAYSLFTKTPPALQKSRDALHYPRWYWVLAGMLSTIGAVSLIAGLALPALGAVAALWGVAYFVAAIFTHLSRKDIGGLAAPIPFLALFVGLAVLRWSDLSPALAPVLALLPL